MSEPTAKARRRGRGEGSIYKDEAKGRWVCSRLRRLRAGR